MIWNGETDPIFPSNYTLTTWDGVFEALECVSVVKIQQEKPKQGHWLTSDVYNTMVNFIREKDAQ